MNSVINRTRPIVRKKQGKTACTKELRQKSKDIKKPILEDLNIDLHTLEEKKKIIRKWIDTKYKKAWDTLAEL